MAVSVFQRKEKKYIIDSEQQLAIESAALPFMTPDNYGQTVITSVYFDTPNRDLISRSLEKPTYKEKLRLRTYGELNGNALIRLCETGLPASFEAHEDLLAIPVFVELKKKYKGIVYKRRVRLSLPAAWAFVNGASYEAAQASYPLVEVEVADVTSEITTATPSAQESRALNHQIARELQTAFGRYENLQPSMAIICKRTAWAPLNEADEPRITFDEDLKFIDLQGDETRAHPVIDEDFSIMEIKASKALPQWLIDALSSNKIYPQSFSKYGRAAQLAQQQTRREESGTCLIPHSHPYIAVQMH